MATESHHIHHVAELVEVTTHTADKTMQGELPPPPSSRKVATVAEVRLNDTVSSAGKSTDALLPLGISVDENVILRQTLALDESYLPELLNLANATLRPGTIKAYKTFLKKWQQFKAEQNWKDDALSTPNVMLFLCNAKRREEGVGFWGHVGPAIKYYEQMSGYSKTCVVPLVERFIWAGLSQAERRRGPVKKATNLPLPVIKFYVDRYVMAFQARPMQIDAMAFRAIYRWVIMYFTFCRFDDYNNLQAKHFVKFNDRIEITFPAAKNDAHHEGRSTPLPRKTGSFCPWTITVMYFKRFDLRFKTSTMTDSSYVNCHVKRQRARGAIMTVAEPTRTLCYSNAVQQARDLLDKHIGTHGFPGAAYTEKSAKMEGVTRALDAGMTTTDAMHHGRWSSPSIPARYKANSTQYKMATASKIPN